MWSGVEAALFVEWDMSLECADILEIRSMLYYQNMSTGPFECFTLDALIKKPPRQSKSHFCFVKVTEPTLCAENITEYNGHPDVL